MTAVAAGGVLVLGYGNALCGDDAVGWHVAEALERDPRLDGARVRWQHQLTPELALDFASSSLVVLVDAVAGPEPGAVIVWRLDPASGAAAGGAAVAVGAVAGAAAMSHHVTPASLLALAGELYGSVPETWVVGVGAAALGVGDELSAEVRAAVPAAADAVAGIVGVHVRA